MKVVVFSTLLVLGACAAAGLAAPRANAPVSESLIVGTFDSRALAVAHTRSAAHREYLSAQMADVSRALERAREAGDVQLVEALEGLGAAKQARLHEQAFGTAPVDDLLALLEDEFPRVAEEEGVDLIVSRWQVTWQREGVTTRDVTEALVQAFEPDEATLRVVRDLLATEPVAAEELDHDH